MQPELSRRALEQDARRFHWHGRQRVRFRARPLERVRSREARNPEIVLGFRIVRLEIGVADRPVGERSARNITEEAALVKIALMEAPVITGEVYRAAAYLSSVFNGLEHLRRLVLVFAIGDWLQLRIVGQS